MKTRDDQLEALQGLQYKNQETTDKKLAKEDAIAEDEKQKAGYIKQIEESKQKMVEMEATRDQLDKDRIENEQKLAQMLEQKDQKKED